MVGANLAGWAQPMHTTGGVEPSADDKAEVKKEHSGKSAHGTVRPRGEGMMEWSMSWALHHIASILTKERLGFFSVLMACPNLSHLPWPPASSLPPRRPPYEGQAGRRPTPRTPVTSKGQGGRETSMVQVIEISITVMSLYGMCMLPCLVHPITVLTCWMVPSTPCGPLPTLSQHTPSARNRPDEETGEPGTSCWCESPVSLTPGQSI